MKTYLSDIIPKIQKYSEKLDNLTLLTNQHWVLIDNIENNKTVYIFRTNGELLISLNGKISKGNWESLGNNSFLIEKGENSYLYKHGFFDKNILALKIDGINEYSFLVNETRYEGELNTIENISSFLKANYLNRQIKESISKKNPSIDLKKPTKDISEIVKPKIDKKKSFIDDHLEYEITNEKKGWAMDTGKYIEFFVSFKSHKGSVVYSSKKDKFCYSKYDNVEYFDNLENCILEYKGYLENK